MGEIFVGFETAALFFKKKVRGERNEAALDLIYKVSCLAFGPMKSKDKSAQEWQGYTAINRAYHFGTKVQQILLAMRMKRWTGQ